MAFLEAFALPPADPARNGLFFQWLRRGLALSTLTVVTRWIAVAMRYPAIGTISIVVTM